MFFCEPLKQTSLLFIYRFYILLFLIFYFQPKINYNTLVMLLSLRTLSFFHSVFMLSPQTFTIFLLHEKLCYSGSAFC
jgi:hypothetical protein